MQELTEFQREFLDIFSHPVLRKESKKELIQDRNVLIKLLCAAFYSEKRKAAQRYTNFSDIDNIESDLEKNKAYILNQSWDIILKSFKVSEELLEEFIEDFNWNTLVKEQILSEKFIRTFKDNLNWKLIAEFQILSEDFAREFAESLDWNLVLIYQTFSTEFVLEFKEKFINNTQVNNSLKDWISTWTRLIDNNPRRIELPELQHEEPNLENPGGNSLFKILLEEQESKKPKTKKSEIEHRYHPNQIMWEHNPTIKIGDILSDPNQRTITTNLSISSSDQVTTGLANNVSYIASVDPVVDNPPVKILKREEEVNKNLRQYSVNSIDTKEHLEKFAESLGVLKKKK